MGRWITEFIGTFFLMLTIALTTIAPGATAAAPFAIGLALMIAVYAGGHVSGAHYNPAVTLGVLLRGKCPASDVIPYVISQLVAAVAAVFVALSLKTDPQIPVLSISLSDALVAEFLFTFALVSVVLNVATTAKTSGNSFFGFAIGGTVGVGAIAVGGISGGIFNPAVGLGLMTIGVLPASTFLYYLAVQLVAAVAAALVFQITNAGEYTGTIQEQNMSVIKESIPNPRRAAGF